MAEPDFTKEWHPCVQQQKHACFSQVCLSMGREKVGFWGMEWIIANPTARGSESLDVGEAE